MSKLKCPKCGYRLQENDDNFIILLVDTHVVVPEGDTDFKIKKAVLDEERWIKCNSCGSNFTKFNKEK